MLRSREKADCLHSELTEQSQKPHILAFPRSKPPLPRERFSPLADRRRAIAPLAASRNEDAYVARRCIPLHFGASLSVDSCLDGSTGHLHQASLGHLVICAATNLRPAGLLCRSWTSIYTAELCRDRNSAARARPQRRQRQRRFSWSTFRLSGVSKWPLPQISGMAMGSRIRSRERHTTSVLVASKHAPATMLYKNNKQATEKPKESGPEQR